jgi:phospholipid/cholesterol/gamma-HCH transport system permease protein
MMTGTPQFAAKRLGSDVRVTLAGHWSVHNGREMERASRDLVGAAEDAKVIVFDLARVEALDTAGAWLIDRARALIEEKGAKTQIESASPAQEILLKEASFRSFDHESPPHGSFLVNTLADVGESVVMAGRDVVDGIAFFGEVVAAFVRTFLRPSRIRITSIVFHLENFGFRSVPIIALINFLVGGIVAQQGIFQLSRFGASTFTVDLIGILVLRELAVLLTSIMIAGRTGSAITAELGSMKMREEIDALRVMGLDPIDVLVLPRIIALLIALPILTFIADLSALFGGLLTAWAYGGLSPDVFMSRLQSAIAMNTFLVGLIKAPIMALMIGMISVIEGFKVQGSAESLGLQVTSSVVKSIFMVIVLDGVFAMFFASINY